MSEDKESQEIQTTTYFSELLGREITFFDSMLSSNDVSEYVERCLQVNPQLEAPKREVLVPVQLLDREAYASKLTLLSMRGIDANSMSLSELVRHLDALERTHLKRTGAYDVGEKKIYISENAIDLREVDKTLVHELIHMLTDDGTRRVGIDVIGIQGDEPWNEVLTDLVSYAILDPGTSVQEIINNIRKELSFNEAYAELLNDIESTLNHTRPIKIDDIVQYLIAGDAQKMQRDIKSRIPTS